MLRRREGVPHIFLRVEAEEKNEQEKNYLEEIK
jgi:hypothetical protein